MKLTESFALCVSLGLLAPAASAQFAESDAVVLFEHSSGPLNNGFGRQVVALGDVNGDGVIDLAASDGGTSNRGRVRAFSGADASELWARAGGSGDFRMGFSLERMDWNADGPLDAMAGTGFNTPTRALSGLDGDVLASLASVGYANAVLASGGDFDGDGTEDLLVGWPDELAELGFVDVFTRGDDLPFTTLFAPPEVFEFGRAVTFVGDIDSPPDGRDEIAVACAGFFIGRVQVYGWGGFSPVLRFSFDGEFPIDLHGGKDVNGDGRPDFAVATTVGVWVRSGVDGAQIHLLGAGESFASVALIDDLDGDGRPEVAAGAPNHSSGADHGGRVFVFSGASGSVLRTFTSTIAHRRLGADVREVGDFDGDGIHDLLVGAESPYPPFGPPPPPSTIGAILVFSLAPSACVTLDFETEDDLATPLINGQHLDVEFGDVATLASAGSNAGLAVFDSTPGGPNDPSQDRDLLVGSGNVLILQTENFPPDANDVFPRPNDDEDGGTITFAFALPAEAASVKLIDVDAGDGALHVVLTDGGGRQRTYTVPSDWTGDLLEGQPGQGTLDLATLAPQPGFGSTATASEDPGFDAQDVSAIAFVLDGSGAIDDLVACFPHAARAGTAVRNGSGVNPMNLRAAGRPVLGRIWSADLDCSGLGPGVATLSARRWAIAGRRSGMGEVLIDGPLVFRATMVQPGFVRRFGWSVPFDLALCGLEVHVQGACRTVASGAAKPGLAGARLSNALDLVLGF